MLSREEFENKYEKIFNDNKCLQSIFDFGKNSHDDKSKVVYIHNIMKNLFDQMFKNKDLYIILFIWNTNFGTEQDLLDLGFDYNLMDKKYDNITIKDHQLTDNPENTIINLLYIEKYNYDKIKFLIQATATWELDLNPTANVNAYFINFSDNNDILINFHDDRGLEILTTSQDLHKQIDDLFHSLE